MTLREWLQKMKREYQSIADDFPNYSPKQERYEGHAKAFAIMLNCLSDEMLNQIVLFK